MTSAKDRAQRLLDVAGKTYAEQAGIRLKNTPAPLYRLLVLSVLLSTRISADIAVAAARELVKAGFGTPRRMLDATWQQRVDGDVDDQAAQGASKVGLPTDRGRLAKLVRDAAEKVRAAS